MSWSPPPKPSRERVREALARRLGVDVRSLAAFRIALGTLLLADLALRSRNLVAFYTDDGVLPRSAVVAGGDPLHPSVHLASGEPWFQALLFALAGALAVALAVGYRTSVATVGSWLLVVSLHNRTPEVLNGGDVLLRLLLFWAMFLPLGARWAVDRRHAARRSDGEGSADTDEEGPVDTDDGSTGANEERTVDTDEGSADARQSARVATVATAALLVQVVVVYAANAAFKLGGDVWLRGEGLAYVFSLGQFTVLLGDHLGSYPAVLRALDYLWLAMICCSFLLIVLTGVRRAAFVGLFVGAHLGMAVTMRLDLFPFVSIAALLVFLPAAFWDRVLPKLAGSRAGSWLAGSRAGSWLAGTHTSSRPAGNRPGSPATGSHAGSRSAGDRRDRRGRFPSRSLEALADLLPAVAVSGVPPRLRRWKERFATVVPLVFLLLILLWNVQVLGVSEVHGRAVVPEPAESALEVTRTDQYWNMFAPDPLATDGWIVAPGRLEDGSRVDAFHGGPVRWGRPDDVSATYPTARWRKYLVGLWRYDTADRRYFAEYLCRRWNGRHRTELRNVSVYFVEQPTRIGAEQEPTNRVLLERDDC